MDELKAMSEVGKVLDELDDEARARVVRWAVDKYDVDPNSSWQGGEAPLTDSAGDQVFMGVDEDKAAEIRAARREDNLRRRDSLGDGAVLRTGELDSYVGPAPERNPDKPAFLDTQFRMYSGKKDLHKEKKGRD